MPTGHYYELTLSEKKVGFLSISRFAHPIAKDIMTISRVVIVPEFQGFGLALKFMNEVSSLYKEENRIRITSSLKSFIEALNRSNNWKCVRFGRVGTPGNSSSIHNKSSSCAVSRNRITATFEMMR